MPAALHPGLLSSWIHKCRYEQIPSVLDIQVFADEWVSWWNSIQPTWRCSTVPNTLPLPLSSAKPNEDVCVLRKYGSSGLVVVITSLVWWASARNTDACWEAAVVNLHSCVKSYMLGGKK